MVYMPHWPPQQQLQRIDASTKPGNEGRRDSSKPGELALFAAEKKVECALLRHLDCSEVRGMLVC